MQKVSTYLLAFILALPAISQTDVITDGSFEQGTPNGAWNEFSTNFGTPLCDPTCNPNYSANTGSWFAWFGGIDTATEIGTLTQQFMVPNGASDVEFEFWLFEPAASANDDSFMVLVDGIMEFLALSSDTTTYGAAYTAVTRDFGAYADGSNHMLELWGYHEANVNGNLTNFMVDDVSLTYELGSAVVRDLLSEGVRILPNPASDQIDVVITAARGSDMAVELLTTPGQLVAMSTVMRNQTGTLHIPVDHLANGTYLLRISDGTSSILETVTVLH
jgi:hypothetical protein